MVGFRDSFWLPIMVVLTGAFLIGVVAGRVTAPSPKNDTADLIRGMRDQVVALDDKVVQMAASRCMTVNTPVLNVAVYETPNLGKKVVK